VRRAFWLAVGLGAGVTAGLVARRWARRTAQAIHPAHVAGRAAGRAREVAALLGEAVAEFRGARAEREAAVRSLLGPEG
jgi:short subunit dehydrogenase-like uncharacterized protein